MLPHIKRMTRDWNDIKWIFEPDGSLIDIYVQDISIKDWEKLIDHLNQNFILTYSQKDQIDKKYALKYLQDSSGEMDSKSLTIHLGQIKVNCYFFLSEQIEFDIDPKEINSVDDFDLIDKFMTSISMVLQEQVTLTAESSPRFPLFKVDVKNEIHKILTENEAKELTERNNSIPSQLSILKRKIKMKLFSESFKKQVLESANQVYRPTKKKTNVW